MMNQNRWLQLAMIVSLPLLFTRPARAQNEVQVKPWFMVIVDNSRSMLELDAGNNTCGFANPTTRLANAKCALNRLVNGVGDAVFGLMNFHVIDCNTQGNCNAGAESGALRAGLVEGNQNAIINFVDDVGTCTEEINVVPQPWNTPLGGSLLLAQLYFAGSAPSPFNGSPTATDSYASCRPMSVILLTDGDESCGGSPQIAATALRSTTIPIPGGSITKDIRTYVIGFGEYNPSQGDTNIEAIATAGGTDAPGTFKGFYATNEAGLSLAFSQIIADSQLIERCNGKDDNCNTVVDEGFNIGQTCSAGIGACEQTGTVECKGDYESGCSVSGLAVPPVDTESNPLSNCKDGIDNDCDGLPDCADSDCDTLPICVSCIAVPEICNGEDDDCDGVVDNFSRPCASACGPGIEICIANSWGACSAEAAATEDCNGIDDDCDGLTDEDLGGGSCGSTEGLCKIGTTRCVNGEWLCEGGTDLGDEVCDGADNDCDGEVDEGLGLGDACGTDGGECKASRKQCINALWVCVGEIGPSKEVCDCKDNDCDGLIDEDAEGSLCPGESICLDCQCALPCAQSAEFKDICPSEKVAYRPTENQCYCVGEACQASQCATQTVASSGQTECEPNSDTVGVCVCKNNKCTFPCDSVTCDSGLVCDPHEGTCKENSCVTFGCEQGQRCDPVLKICESDLCATTTCAEDQACRDGECFKSCASVSCGTGQRCVDGVCESDKCAHVSCDAQKACEQTTGTCQTNACLTVKCQAGCVCDRLSGECVADPCLKLHCPAGESCCGGVCIDGRTDHGYCGAAGDCSGEEAGRKCASNESCQRGVCAAISSNTPDSIIKRGTAVIAAGGGGCACTVTAGGNSAGSERWIWAVGFMWVALFRLRMKKRSVGVGRRIPGLAGSIAFVGAIAAAGALLSGCHVNAFCLDCQKDAGSGTVKSDAGHGQAGYSGNTGEADGEVGPTTDGQAATTDGQTGGDGANTCVNANLDTDPKNCGQCGRACIFEHAFVECVAGQCRMNQCDVGFLDLDQDASNGCEYACLHSADDDTSCNRSDDDCDGLTDEDVYLQTDPENCGGCGKQCQFAHASNGGLCQDGVCILDKTKCDPGFSDVDGIDSNGCENEWCKLPDPPTELCNLRDDDCDGLTDEAQSDDNNNNHITINDVRIGLPCREGKGECTSGRTVCKEGQMFCAGFTPPSNEVCDGKDNDCDGYTDEIYAQLNKACASSGIGECITRGTWQCKPTDPTAALICVDGEGEEAQEGSPKAELSNGKDDNCDGRVDEPCLNPTVTGNDCAQDAWVKITSTVYMYAYEASRPDATDTSGGISNARAVSAAGKMPWTNITYPQAKAACEAAGARLCREDAEWKTACMSTGSCTWSYAANCTSYSANTCNGADYDTDSQTAGDQDAIKLTGSMPNCYREYNSAKVYDLSGNVKEWVQARSTGVNPLRGGATNNPQDGIGCDFDFTLADDKFLFFNAGFRCCYGP